MAERYDALRPLDAAWRARFDALVREGDLRGRRVLDVGCGTGALAEALAAEHHAKVWGVDSSPAMVSVARRRIPRGTGVRRGRAEELPFRDGWFERVVMSLVAHLVDRPAAFREARRVLGPDGRIAIATFAPGHFGRTWLDPFFPSLERVDRARFAGPEQLAAELLEAGFEPRRAVVVETSVVLARSDALARLRGRHISTFDLLDPAEVAAGIARAEQELPQAVPARLEQLVLAGSASQLRT